MSGTRRTHGFVQRGKDVLYRQVELWRERDATFASRRLRETVYDDSRITRGRHSYGEPRVVTYPGDTACVRIGAFCSIAVEVTLMDGGNHRPDWVTTSPLRVLLDLPGAYADGHPATRGDIVLGNDVWIGRGAQVLSGVTIGDGAVVGGYTVVTKDVRPYAIVVGNPGREIRRRFSDEQVAALLRIAWWDWPNAQVIAAVDGLCSDNIDAFIAAHDPGPAAGG